MEKSLLLFKPNAFLNPLVFKEAEKLLKENSLEIFDTFRFVINSNQIMGIWSHRCFDPFIHNVMIKAYEGKEFLLWKINGADALKICMDVKRKIRQKYALSFINNCIHCPKDTKEYRSNLQAIDEVNVYKPSEEYDKLEKTLKNTKRLISFEDFDKCCTDFVDVDETVYKRVFINDKKYEIVLHIDNIHWMTEYAMCLYDNMPDISLKEAYIYAYTVVEYEDVPIFASSDLSEINKMMDSLNDTWLKLGVCERV